jgi:hypothetical protein
MENLAQMTASGGILLTNAAPSVALPAELEEVSGVPEGIMAYRRR